MQSIDKGEEIHIIALRQQKKKDLVTPTNQLQLSNRLPSETQSISFEV